VNNPDALQLINELRKCGTMKFYSVIKKNETIWFEGKWTELKNIMLYEMSQAQKDKGHVFSLIYGRQSQKINVYAKTNMTRCTFICRTCL
jgi:hypothetical protein